MSHICTNVSVEKNDRSEVEIKAEIPAEEVSKYRTKAIKKLASEVSIDGFRKGHVPEDVLLKHVGENAIMQETADIAFTEQYPLLMQEQKLAIIGSPNISITKLATGNPIAFTIKAALMPEVTLPDYKTIAKKHTKNNIEADVSEKEVEETLTHLRRERAKIEKLEAGANPQEAAEEVAKMDTLSLPGLDDAFVQSLGFENVEKFKEKLRENIKHEKELREREKRRIAIIEDIIKGATIPLPQLLVDNELNTMEGQFAADLERGGTTLDAYLNETGKSREDLRKEWTDGAEKRAKMQLILRDIAQSEKIEAPKEEVEHQVKHILEHHKEANEEQARIYFQTMLRNEATLRWLEEQK